MTPSQHRHIGSLSDAGGSATTLVTFLGRVMFADVLQFQLAA
jgi:hypothetical protein